MANVYDTANQMAADIKTTQEFQDLKKALIFEIGHRCIWLVPAVPTKQYEM
ncbi:hypothetical protein AAULR_14314, partial [Lacticaseibacillus rhamnosus MTCC 5462]